MVDIDKRQKILEAVQNKLSALIQRKKALTERQKESESYAAEINAVLEAKRKEQRANLLDNKADAALDNEIIALTRKQLELQELITACKEQIPICDIDIEDLQEEIREREIDVWQHRKLLAAQEWNRLIPNIVSLVKELYDCDCHLPEAIRNRKASPPKNPNTGDVFPYPTPGIMMPLIYTFGIEGKEGEVIFDLRARQFAERSALCAATSARQVGGDLAKLDEPRFEREEVPKKKK